MAKEPNKVSNPLTGGSSGNTVSSEESLSATENAGNVLTAVPGYVAGKVYTTGKNVVNSAKKGVSKVINTLEKNVVQKPSQAVAKGVGNAVAAFFYGTNMSAYNYGEVRSAVSEMVKDGGENTRALPKGAEDMMSPKQRLMRGEDLSL